MYQPMVLCQRTGRAQKFQCGLLGCIVSAVISPLCLAHLMSLQFSTNSQLKLKCAMQQLLHRSARLLLQVRNVTVQPLRWKAVLPTSLCWNRGSIMTVIEEGRGACNGSRGSAGVVVDWLSGGGGGLKWMEMVW